MPAGMPPGFSEVWPTLQTAASEEAGALGMAIVSINFAKGKLSILASGGGIEDLEQLNRRLGDVLDRWEVGDGEEGGSEAAKALPAYMLEVASPGVSDLLLDDRDFETFKGFEVRVRLSEEFKKKTDYDGTLQGRDEDSVLINLKGRIVKLPRGLVIDVRLPSALTEAGDPY